MISQNYLQITVYSSQEHLHWGILPFSIFGVILCACGNITGVISEIERFSSSLYLIFLSQEEKCIRSYTEVLNLTLSLPAEFSNLKIIGLNCIQSTKNNDKSFSFEKQKNLDLHNEQSEQSYIHFISFPSIHQTNPKREEGQKGFYHPISSSSSSSWCQTSLQGRKAIFPFNGAKTEGNQFKTVPSTLLIGGIA